MAELGKYLNDLANEQEHTFNDDGNDFLREFEQWTKSIGKPPASSSVEPGAHDQANDTNPSVLDIFKADLGAAPSESSMPAPVRRLLSRQTFQAHIPKLTALLTSSRGDDQISEEVVELLGFDEMDLVMEILQDRQSVGQKFAS
ncbi:hypothetical protein BOTBODRAFT_555477 [Botryobasidium botryosum FD-172 SS1]|uniref:Uncharacterized protein n=1 Tax=Botryobasidium botryosum (strain FD-172 SS1) TaxID=930990 RepID=A0A067M019_BOTB1|nr:hypothetical protein BOTBODRAFT_555477 [Botryobasidium botryosum FD-172 SS1]